MGDDCWRIDDLAHEAGITVDTIRYYAREGLLPAPTPAGRHRLYGDRHLDRLRRIKELQERRFSLAAIRAIVETNRPGIDDIFAGAGRTYTLAELIERSGVAPELVAELHRVDVLPDPAEFGRAAYDDTDLHLLEAIVELQNIGMPAEVLVELGTIYVRNFQVLQREVIDMLAGRTRPDWKPEMVRAVQTRLSASAGRLIPAIERVLNYVHQRTLQRFTLEAIRSAQDHGVEVDLDPSPPR
jgi:DNA-binding transcriptional MerR regulator